MKEKDKYHFVMIISETDYFSEFEEKYYKNKNSEINKKHQIFGLQTRVSKILDQERVKYLDKGNSSKNNIEKKNKLLEYDYIKNIIKNFVNKNIPYVSYINGGFKEIHDYSIKTNIPIKNHEENLCHICADKKKKLYKNKGLFSRLFDWRKSI